MSNMHVLEQLNNVQSVCVGCTSCVAICKHGALKMQENPQGFLFPTMDETKCIRCGACANVCPVIDPDDSNRETPKCYAAWASDEERSKSSSGAIFPLIANWILKEGGLVCGAVFDNSFNVMHICSDKESDVEKMRRSKYVQSNMQMIQREILDHLKDGRKVLFTGCPCQVAAVKKYCKVYSKELYLADILCTGISSNKEWQDYLRENRYHKNLVKVNFRDKQALGMRCDGLTLTYKNGRKIVLQAHEFIYGRGMFSHLTTRDCCRMCEFGGMTRQGDITIGDFWGIAEYNKALNDGKGVSVILSNNEKGDRLLNAISSKCKTICEAPIELAKRRNRLWKSMPEHKAHDHFKILYPENGFTISVCDALNMRRIIHPHAGEEMVFPLNVIIKIAYKIPGGIRCFHEHGLKYTLNRIIFHCKRFLNLK